MAHSRHSVEVRHVAPHLLQGKDQFGKEKFVHDQIVHDMYTNGKALKSKLALFSRQFLNRPVTRFPHTSHAQRLQPKIEKMQRVTGCTARRRDTNNTGPTEIRIKFLCCVM